jgi:molybdopterin converting factor subunit 1
MKKHIHLQYFAVLREQAGRSDETLETEATDPAQLYEQVRSAHGFTLPRAMLRVAVNDEFRDWNAALASGDRVVFIPPVAGG